MAGYVLVAEGVGFTVASMLCGPLTSLIPRAAQMLVAFCSFVALGLITWAVKVNMTLCSLYFVVGVYWMFWEVQGTEYWSAILFCAGFGACNGTLRTHVTSKYNHDPSVCI